MEISEAQKEMRVRFAGGFYGQLVSGVLWLISAGLATWSTPRTAIMMLVIGGFFIFPLTELMVRLGETNRTLSPGNSLWKLGMQVAFVLPASMPLVVPVSLYRLSWFYPAMMILLGAHYLPFMFLYGMRVFGVLAALLVAGGIAVALYLPSNFNLGAWIAGLILLVFAILQRRLAQNEQSSQTI
jgi:hypothetical protein